MKLSKSFIDRYPDMTYAGYCFFWIICGHFACSYCWATLCCVCRAPWICCSVRQQSVAVSNELWKQKL